MIAIGISLEDLATPALHRLESGLEPSRINPVIGRSAVNVFKAHLVGLSESRPNALGGTSTRYYANASRATHFDEVPDGVVISINQVGMALHYYGGTVRPVKAKYLTIPVAPEAHGKRAGEFQDLEVIFGHGGLPIALASKGTRTVRITQTKSGKIIKRHTGHLGTILFRLVKSATIKADPGVLPEKQVVRDRINKDLESYINRLWKRASGGPN